MSRFRIWAYIIQWVQDEYAYATTKVTQDPESDDRKTEEDPFYWSDQIAMYAHRAAVLGLQSPAGRQAAAKCAMTAMCFAESAVRKFGALPEPGVPSGENLDNLRPL